MPVHEHEFEDSLEPKHLNARSDLVLRAGIMMLGSGTSGLRVREVMQAVAATVGLRDISAQISFTDVVLTVRRRSTFRTQVSEIARPAVDAHRIDLLQRFGQTLPARATVAEVSGRLDAIENQPKLYRAWLTVLLVALACASVTVLGNGGPREVAAVLPASGLAYAAHRVWQRLDLNHLASVATTAALATGLYVGFTRIIDLAFAAPSPRLAAGFICAAIFLIPGFPLVTAGLDLARVDMETGVPRLAYALMVLLSITIGVWLVATASGISPDAVPTLTGAWVWPAWMVASWCAVFGWAVMFNAPWQAAVASGVCAALGNVPRLLLIEFGVKPYIATFIGCFLMGLLCAVAARAFDLNKIIMTVPTVLVSIPGAPLLRTLLYFDKADIVSAMTQGVSTILAVISLVAGLAAARMLTDPEWTFTRPWRPGERLSHRLFGRPDA